MYSRSPGDHCFYWLSFCVVTLIDTILQSCPNLNYIISSVMHVFWLVLTYDLLEDRRIDGLIIKFFLNSLLYKQNRFQVVVCPFSNIDQRGRQNVVRTSVTHSAAPRVPLFCSYHILMLSVIYYWTDAWQLGIYLLYKCIHYRQKWAKLNHLYM